MGTNARPQNSRCIFCLKKNKTSKNSLNKFLRCFSRYIKIKTNLVESNTKLHTCADCFLLTESFCGLFFQQEFIELQLNWKIKRIFDSIQLSARFYNSKCEFNDDDDVDDQSVCGAVQNIRNDLLMHGNQKLDSAFPKVVLNRLSLIKTEKGDNNWPSACKVEQKKGDFLPDVMSYLAVCYLSLPMQNRPVPPIVRKADENTQTCHESESNGFLIESEEAEIEDSEVRMDVDQYDNDNYWWPPPVEEASMIQLPNKPNQFVAVEMESIFSQEFLLSSTPLLKCPKCTVTFANEERLNWHVKLHNDFEREINPLATSQSHFDSDGNYFEHGNQSFSIPNSNLQTNTIPLPMMMMMTEKQHPGFRYWSCTTCAERFSSPEKYAWHEISKHGQKSGWNDGTTKFYQCTRCLDSFDFKRYIVKHFLRSHLNIKPKKKKS